ncbi:sensor histidine kinase [Tessaracoccus antarcticus]|uniref:Sensor-like histidine kinase SenX3 n=1 Tax=Tessaracoccus antarcticus TaxID=2479848 RepID=A0A3M0GDX7_9ACTN|nr:ATP-binding protein [Tessaracoccus antarcticus]RMB62488.1 two-component sensor histidine kinase [Tessaracoccus antarcticus]
MPPVFAGLIGAATTLLLVVLVLTIRRTVASRQQLTAPRAGSIASTDMSRVVGALRAGTMLVGSHDEVLTTNQTALAMGLARGTRVGFPELLELVRRARISGEIFRGHIEREREPGSEAVQLTGRVVPLEDGVVLVITEDESATQRVEAVRRDFVANVSHELKTPVGAIGILAEAVEAASDDPEAVSRFASRLQVESARLAELVGQIIELSRLQAADPSLTLDVVDIEDVIDEALGRSREAAHKRSVVLTRTQAQPAQVLGDQWQLTDAVANLVQNAISYSGHQARVSVSVSSVTTGDDEFVDIKVSDNGIGIAPDEQERIFERFYRVDYGRSRESGGTGLGLAIVRHIASSHGGTISVWSRPRQGSTFTLRLPSHTKEGNS